MDKNETQIRKVLQDDPDRCQAVTRLGQCNNARIPNGTVCMVHGGNSQIASMETASLNTYRLAKWQSRVEQHSSNNNIKNLRSDIGILRLLIEERISSCSDSQDLLLQSQPISDLVAKVEKVVTSCHKLEVSMSELLDKEQVAAYTANLFTILEDIITPAQMKIITMKLKEMDDVSSNDNPDWK